MKIRPNMENVTPLDMKLIKNKMAAIYDVSFISIESRSPYLDREMVQSELLEIMELIKKHVCVRTALIKKHVCVRTASQSLLSPSMREWDVQLLLDENTLNLQILPNEKAGMKEKIRKCKQICTLLSECPSIRLAAEVHYHAMIVASEEERKQGIRLWKNFDKELKSLSIV